MPNCRINTVKLYKLKGIQNKLCLIIYRHEILCKKIRLFRNFINITFNS